MCTYYGDFYLDLVKEIQHPYHMDRNSSLGTQTVINVFDLGVLKNDKVDNHSNLTKAILRIYKDSNETDECSKATIQSKLFFKHANKQAEMTGNKITLNMCNGRNWEEIDLTMPMKSLWPIPEGGYELYIIVIVKSECANKNLPIKLRELKAIKKLKARRKLYAEQPVLCMFISNEAGKRVARNPNKPISSIPSDETFIIPMGYIPDNSQKRDTRAHGNKCHRVDHTVSFSELRIDYVIAPSHFNAGRCVGNCDSEFLHSVTVTGELQKSNNYAKLLANQAYRRNDKTLQICCSPSQYESVMLLILTADGSSVKQKMYHEMSVRDCYCR